MINTIRILKKQNIQILIIGPTPVFPDNEFMRSSPLFSVPYSPPKKLSLSMMDKTPFIISNKLENWATRNDVEFISINDAFCKISFCGDCCFSIYSVT